MASHAETKIDCSKVYVKRSSFATNENEFDGAFAAVPIKKGMQALRLRIADMVALSSTNRCFLL
jgi:hypothetical protein